MNEQSVPFFFQQIITDLSNPALWIGVGWVILRIIVYYIVGRIVVFVVSRTITRMMVERKHRLKSPISIDRRRSQTIGKLVSNVVSYSVHIIVLMLILSELGVDVAPLIAGAGVLGLAIGFGAQSLVKDVITGFFIIIEDQFGVGDVIKTGNFEGTVDEIGLRVTRIRSWTGEVHFIPNGSINQVTNYSVNNSLCVLDVPLDKEMNLDAAVENIRKTAIKVCEASENTVGEPKVLGVESISTSGAVIRVTVECKPMMQNDVKRELNIAIKKVLDVEKG